MLVKVNIYVAWSVRDTLHLIYTTYHTIPYYTYVRLLDSLMIGSLWLLGLLRLLGLIGLIGLLGLTGLVGLMVIRPIRLIRSGLVGLVGLV